MNAERCPDREMELSVLQGSRVPVASAAEVLYHLSRCDECRKAVSFVCAAEVVSKKAEENRVLVFQSKCQKSERGYWRAEVCLGTPDDTVGSLSVHVTDAHGKELVGNFSLCGSKCSIGRGLSGKISVTDFRKGHMLGGVAFARQGETSIEGVPVIGSIL